MSMKYILTESKLHSAMIKLFEKEMSPEKLNYYNVLTTDEDDNEYESNDAFAFYNPDDDESAVFRYYTCDYFDEKNQIECPIVSLENYFEDKFDDLFGDLWKPIFLEWVNERFELNAKVVD